MRCMFPRGIYQCQLKGCCVSVDLEDYGLTSRYDQPERILACPQQSFYANILTPKDGGRFVLASLTDRSHQVNSRNLLGPCFTVVVYVEIWRPMLNVQLSYKHPSSWRILFRYWGRTKQFSCLKKFRALVVPGRGCRKGIILQGILTHTGVLQNGQ